MTEGGNALIIALTLHIFVLDYYYAYPALCFEPL
jgi:hypothetical protein